MAHVLPGVEQQIDAAPGALRAGVQHHRNIAIDPVCHLADGDAAVHMKRVLEWTVAACPMGKKRHAE